LNTDSVDDMITLLDDFIFSLITNAKTESPIIKYATTQIANDPSKESLVAVQKELHITERTFQRIFKKYVGITPNQYRRICQFQLSFYQLRSKDFNKLTDIAYDSGFADQSHFIRSFKEFTQITPNDYLKSGLKDKNE